MNNMGKMYYGGPLLERSLFSGPLRSLENAVAKTRMIFMILGFTAVVGLILSNIILFRDPSEKNSYRSLLWYARGMVLSFLSPIALVHSTVAIPVSVIFLAAMEYFLSKTRETNQA